MSSETEAEAELAGARHKLENGLDTHVGIVGDAAPDRYRRSNARHVALNTGRHRNFSRGISALPLKADMLSVAIDVRYRHSRRSL